MRPKVKWGMPAFSNKRLLVTLAAHKNHIGFYPTPSAVKPFAKELARFNAASGSIQFPLGKPLPLIHKITEFRVRESVKQDGKMENVREWVPNERRPIEVP